MTECHSDLEHRITVAGDYTTNQCAINITDIRPEDAGDWECEVSEAGGGLRVMILSTVGGLCHWLGPRRQAQEEHQTEHFPPHNHHQANNNRFSQSKTFNNNNYYYYYYYYYFCSRR